jgi:hypothetical protein
MFLHRYFWGGSSGDGRVAPPLSLIAVLKLYLTDFLECPFLGEFNKNRAFCGGEKLNITAVYPPDFN